MDFDKYYDEDATDCDVIREVYKGLRPEVKDRAHRDIRHALYREVMSKRVQMAQLLGWYGQTM